MEKKQKFLSMKYVLFFVAAITLLLIAVYVILYLNAKNITEAQLGSNAQSVAVSVSSDIMGEIEEYKTFLETRDTDSDYYNNIKI